MAKPISSFGRNGRRYKPQPTILVICEDSKSAPRYLDDAARYFRIQVTVKIMHCGKTDPKGIVSEALRLAYNFDRIFCAIDRDTHENFDEALLLSKKSDKVKVIASYPCFEYWYLIHFRTNRAPYMPSGNRSAADNLLNDLRACAGMERYEKGRSESLFETLLPNFETARQASPRVLAQAQAEQSLNPSTEVHDLIEFFEKLMGLEPNA